MIRAIGFDIGGTLVHYGTPFNWSSRYRSGLEQAFSRCSLTITDEKLASAVSILSKYNTRENPREYEISAVTIFSEILSVLNLEKASLEPMMESFFSFFLAEASLYPEVKQVLSALKFEGIKLGVYTNVAYGMLDPLALRDIVDLSPVFDVVLTSVSVGYRKPNAKGYQILLHGLNAKPDEMLFVGDEENDIVGANRLGIGSVLVNRSGGLLNFGQRHTIQSLAEIPDLLPLYR